MRRRTASTTVVRADYVFLDIERFTQQRSVESQAAIISVLNEIVKTSLSGENVRRRILLPTGDGMCIALLEPRHDLALRVTLHILAAIEQHNHTCDIDDRRFGVRAGINSGDDVNVIDINGRNNLAGQGINMANRIMSLADGGQILVGQAIFDRLNPRQQYMGCFAQFSATVKGGQDVDVYQFVRGDAGVNVLTPRALQPKRLDAVPKRTYPETPIPDPEFERDLTNALEASSFYAFKGETASFASFRLATGAVPLGTEVQILILDPNADDILRSQAELRLRVGVHESSRTVDEEVRQLKREILSTIATLHRVAHLPIDLRLHRVYVVSRAEILSPGIFLSYYDGRRPFPGTAFYENRSSLYNAHLTDFRYHFNRADDEFSLRRSRHMSLREILDHLRSPFEEGEILARAEQRINNFKVVAAAERRMVDTERPPNSA